MSALIPSSIIHHTKVSERACAAMHLNDVQSKDFSILDKGYNAFIFNSSATE